MTNIISGEKASIGVNLSAPTSSTTVGSHLRTLVETNSLTGNDKGDITIAVPTTSTTNNLTSIGRFKDSGSNNEFGSLWRMRVGVGNGSNINATLSAYGGSFSELYELLEGYDTFAISPKFTGQATHTLQGPGINKVKAAGNQDAATASPSISNTDDYDIIGSNFNDTLTGANGDDTLTGGDGNDLLRGRGGSDSLRGEGGNDRLFGGGAGDDLEGGIGNDLLAGGGGNDDLTGGAGTDRFRFTNQGIDDVTDFNPNDIFQIRLDRYPTDTPVVDPPKVGLAGSIDPDVNIYVDDFMGSMGSMGIEDVISSTVYFAYATDTNELLYDADGDWGSGSEVIATTNNDFGIPTDANFDFI